MSLLLGIFSKRNKVEPDLLAGMLGDFSEECRRPSTRRNYPGAVFVAVASTAPERVFSEPVAGAALTGLVGSLSGPGSDIASLLEAFASNGLERADGAFVGFRYDPVAHELTLANDKFGMRPLFIAEAGDLVAFCSEYQPLLQLPGLDKALDPNAIAEFFGLGVTLGNKTFFRHIRNLGPGSMLSLSVSGSCERRYWSPDIAIRHGDSSEHAAELVAATVVTVVRELVDEHPGLLCLLSAGADSRLILSSLRDDQRCALRFLTSKLSVLQTHEDRDAMGAVQLARGLGLKHEVLDVAYSELEFGPDYFDRERRLRPRELLGGWHGGEFLGGCCVGAAPIEPGLDRAAVDARLTAVFSVSFLISLDQHPWDAYQAWRGSLAAENRDFLARIELMSRPFFSNIYKGSQGHWLQPYQFIHHGHSPFWDSRFLSAMLKVPFALVQDYGLYNTIYRDQLPALKDYPSNSMLTRRPDSALAPMIAGQEPKALLKIRPRQLDALEQLTVSDAIHDRGDYAPGAMAAFLSATDASAPLMFVDFETWRARYADASG